MRKLLRFELRNMSKQIVVYVVVATILIVLSLVNNTPSGRLEYYTSIGYGIEDMIVGALTSCFFTSFMAVIVAFIVCRDYEQNVIKNVLAKGFSHEEVYFSKFIFTMLVTAIICLLTIGLGIVEAIMVFGPGKTDIFAIMFAQFIAVLAYSSLAYMVCQLVKKTGFSIIILVAVPPLGGLLFDQIDRLLPFDFSLGSLWITQTMSYIHGGTIETGEIVASLITSLVYIVGCYFVGLKFSMIKK